MSQQKISELCDITMQMSQQKYPIYVISPCNVTTKISELCDITMQMSQQKYPYCHARHASKSG
jgi:hypothetical protein